MWISGDKLNGDLKLKRAITSSPLVEDGIVYFASLDSTFYALDAKSGWIVWRFQNGKRFRYPHQ